MEVLVGYVLLIGVLLSMALVAIGIVWRWLTTGQLGLNYSITGMNFFEFVVEDVRQLVQGNLRPRLFMNLGIAVLLLTPFTRVLASVFYFAFAARNWKYVLFTGFVLSVLTYSLFLR
jgi:uncharacterized membrane protein